MDTAADCCPSCQARYDGSKKRKLIDSCGHPRCFSCMYAADDCPLCVKAKNGKDARSSSSVLPTYQESIYASTRDGHRKPADLRVNTNLSNGNASHYAVPHRHRDDNSVKDGRPLSSQTQHYKDSGVQRSASHRVTTSAGTDMRYRSGSRGKSTFKFLVAFVGIYPFFTLASNTASLFPKVLILYNKLCFENGLMGLKPYCSEKEISFTIIMADIQSTIHKFKIGQWCFQV